MDIGDMRFDARAKNQKYAVLLGAVLFFGMFAGSVQPVWAEAKGCYEDIKNGIGIGETPLNVADVLIRGCGWVKDLGTGQLLACYHSLDGILAVVIKAGEILLGVVGALALLMFVWGGFQWLTAAGTEKRIQEGTTTLKNAIIGLIIVFGAWLAVNFIVATLNPSPEGKIKLAFQPASEQWWQIHQGAICLRPMSSKELAASLAGPAVIETEPMGQCCWNSTIEFGKGDLLEILYKGESATMRKSDCADDDKLKSSTPGNYIKIQDRRFCRSGGCGNRKNTSGNTFWDMSSMCKDSDSFSDWIDPSKTPPQEEGPGFGGKKPGEPSVAEPPKEIPVIPGGNR